MLIEQKSLDLFNQMNSWAMSSHDTPKEVLELETLVDTGNKDFGDYKEWNSLELKQIFASEPKFSQVDLRELFWVSRDNLVDQMSGIALIPPLVKIFSTRLTMQILIVLEKISVIQKFQECHPKV